MFTLQEEPKSRNAIMCTAPSHQLRVAMFGDATCRADIIAADQAGIESQRKCTSRQLSNWVRHCLFCSRHSSSRMPMLIMSHHRPS
jgi:hypothetical protein